MNELYGIFMSRNFNWTSIKVTIDVTIEMLNNLKTQPGQREKIFLDEYSSGKF